MGSGTALKRRFRFFCKKNINPCCNIKIIYIFATPSAMVRRTTLKRTVMRIEKYFHLVIGIILMVSAVCLAVYGIYVDRLYLCGEGFVVAILALMLIHGYREAVQMEKEEDGI